MDNDNNSTELQDMEGSSLSGESGSLSKDKLVSFDDPYGDALLAMYKGMNLDESSTLKTLILAGPIGLIAVFYMFVS